ncbi:MAG: hypothetical protein LUD17_14740 [Bacteroidales bacterium]|nr:hypothetical protein [Bacteroidales bacterium]
MCKERFVNPFTDFGLASAEKKGRIEEKMDIARNMKADGEPFEKIVRYTGLTIQEIENL